MFVPGVNSTRNSGIVNLFATKEDLDNYKNGTMGNYENHFISRNKILWRANDIAPFIFTWVNDTLGWAAYPVDFTSTINQ
jgi:hypothetical protein